MKSGYILTFISPIQLAGKTSPVLSQVRERDDATNRQQGAQEEDDTALQPGKLFPFPPAGPPPPALAVVVSSPGPLRLDEGDGHKVPALRRVHGRLCALSGPHASPPPERRSE